MDFRKLSVSDVLPIQIERIKAAMRIDHSFEDDHVKRVFLAAVDLVEKRTRRILRPTTFEASLRAWPCSLDDALALTLHPIRDVTSVRYLGDGGTVPIEVGVGDWSWRGLEVGAEVYFLSAWDFPTVNGDSRAPITIQFSAGYDSPAAEPGTDPERILPAQVEELLLLLASHWFKNREAVTTGTSIEVPLSAELLLKELRIFR